MENDNLLARSIRNKILSNFISAEINITYDKEQNEYFISTRDKNLYYSEAYGLLILDIKQNILWEQGKYNFYFTLDVQEREFDYKSWDIVKKTPIFVDKQIDTDYFPLLAA